jgi:hypothetical protein
MSEHIVHEFTIKRKIRGEEIEFELKASFDVFPATLQRTRRSGHAEGGRSELVGEIFLVDGGVHWDGRLTKREKECIEDEVYETWLESNDTSNLLDNRLVDDSCLVDTEFDDGFDIDMAVKVAGHGKVTW